MKTSAWDSKLWHDKMQEIPLEGDMNSAWANMQGLLDEAMPVVNTGVVAKKVLGISRSLLLTLFYTAAAAAIVILSTHYILKEKPHTAPKHYNQPVKPYDRKAGGDSAKTETDSTSTNAPAVPPGGSDSTGANNPPAGNADETNAGKNAKSDVSANSASPASSSTPVVGSPGKKLLKNAQNNGTVKSRMLNSNVQKYHAGANTSSVNQTNAPGNIGTVKNTVGNARQAASVTTGVIASSTNAGKQGGVQKAGNDAAPNNGTGKFDTPVPGHKQDDVSGNKPIATKVDSAGMPQNTVTATANKSEANTKSEVMKTKRAQQLKAQNLRMLNNKKFELAISAGANISNGVTSPYVALTGSCIVTPKLSINVGASMFSSRQISGSYTRAKYKYNTVGDSGHITSHTEKIAVNSSQKINTLDIPVTATYKVNKWLSLKGGPVITIPVKTGAINNKLSPVSTTLDTAVAYKTLTNTINNTTSISNVNLSITAGAMINLKRFYLEAGYVQGLGAYTINSSLGTGEAHYHAVQIGIGYKIFKPKPNH